MTAFFVPANEAFSDYDGLIAALNDWMDRNDLTGAAPQMIALAEDEMITDLEPLLLEATADIAAVDGIAVLPLDIGTISRVSYDGRTLKQVPVTGAMNIPTGGNEPHAYTLEAGKLRLWPACNVTVSVLYSPSLPRLSQGNKTNELLQRFPSIYFYSAMVFANGYVADDARARTFRSLFDNMMAKVKKHLTRQRYGGPLVPRVAFVP